MPDLFTLTGYAYKYRSDAPTLLSWGNDSLRLDALRNETVACQLVIRPAETVLASLGQAPLLHWTPTARLRIALQQWQGPDGLQPLTEAFFVGTVPVDKGDTLIADPLLHEESIEVPSGCPQAVWISVRFSASAAPGAYHLPITLYRAADFIDEDIVGRVEVIVNLLPLTLPEPCDFTHHLDLWQHPCGIARGHGVPLWSEAHWQLIEVYARELARLGQKAITIIASDAPWAGQRCRHNPEYPSTLHEYNIIAIHRTPDGTLHFDFSRLDRYIEIYVRLGIDREIGIIGLLAAWDEEFGRPLADHSDNVRLACIDDQSGAITWLRTQAELGQYLAALRDHLQQRGWWQRSLFEADEPSDVQLFRQRIDFLRSVCPDARIKAPINHMEMVDAFLNDVADWTPQLEGIGRDVDRFQAAKQQVQARGDRFTWYVCCGPARPNTFITSPLIESRFLGWYSAWAGLDGFLRWAFTCWPADPWHRPAWRFPSWPSGDMFFVYPGNDGRPVRSLRTELLLFGIQDFELIALARRQAQGVPSARAALDAAFARVVRGRLADFVDVKNKRPEELYSLDPADYDAARTLIVDCLAQTSVL
jgi:hypothetical protein